MTDIKRLAAECMGFEIGEWPGLLKKDGKPVACLQSPEFFGVPLWNPLEDWNQVMMLEERIKELDLWSAYDYRLYLITNSTDQYRDSTKEQRIRAAIEVMK